MVRLTRLVGQLVAITILVTVVIPHATPTMSQASATGLGAGHVVSGNFGGTSRSQIASLYDARDDLGLRIVVLTPAAGSTGGTMTAAEWFLSGPNSFDIARMKVVASDANFDGKTDLVVLYEDGPTAVRLLVFLSTGTRFVYAGAWWRSEGYAFSRTKAVLSGNFSAIGNQGLLFVYQYDDFQMRIHYLESDGKQYLYGGDDGVYDSGVGQYDTARTKFAIGRFTRRAGPDQLAVLYQYPNLRIRMHLFDPTPVGLRPQNGWAGLWESEEGAWNVQYVKLAVGDVNDDGYADIRALQLINQFGQSKVSWLDGSLQLIRYVHDPNFTGKVYGSDVYAWAQSTIVGGDWNGDRLADMAAVEARPDGTTRVTLFTTSFAPRFFVDPTAWVSPASY